MYFTIAAIVDSREITMPLSELEKKWWGMDFDIAAEEMRRLKSEPNEEEKLLLYGLFKQAIHGDIPELDVYPKPEADTFEMRKYEAWMANKGRSKEACKEEYVRVAEEMIKKYNRHIVRSKWNSEVWSVDY